MTLPAPLPSEFAEPLAHAADRLGPFAGQVVWYQDVASTNDLAAGLAEQGAREGCIVLANAQSAGRGRQGRTWASPAGAGLYVSIVLTPPVHAVPLLTIAAGVAVAEGIRSASGLEPCLKWPNDVHVGDRKVAGVLAEASSPSTDSNPATAAGRRRARRERSQPVPGVRYVILGVGINVLPAAYPPEIAAQATSLEGELGRQVDRGLLLAACLCTFARRYSELQRGEASAVIDAWRTRAAPTLGRAVRWAAAGTAWEGIAEDIDETGALVVRTPAGLVRLISGEVRWT